MGKIIAIIWLAIGFYNYTKFKIETGHKTTILSDIVGMVLVMLTGPLVYLLR